MNTLVGDLPRHLYVYVDSTFTHLASCGFVPAVWFGLVSHPGRMWGCTVMLESGAIYRNLPPHALAFRDRALPSWTPEQAQTWDCYGERFSCIEYQYLSGLAVSVRAGKRTYDGRYLFTAAPVGDGYSEYPEQAKEFMFIRTFHDRLTVQPTNHVLFTDKSFTRTGEWPKLKRQVDVYRCE